MKESSYTTTHEPEPRRVFDSSSQQCFMTIGQEINRRLCSNWFPKTAETTNHRDTDRRGIGSNGKFRPQNPFELNVFLPVQLFLDGRFANMSLGNQYHGNSFVHMTCTSCLWGRKSNHSIKSLCSSLLLVLLGFSFLFVTVLYCTVTLDNERTADIFLQWGRHKMCIHPPHYCAKCTICNSNDDLCLII